MRILFVMLMFFAAPAYALTVDTPLPNAVQEAHAQQLFREIRCVVCQGESIADSPADVAADMRRAVRNELLAGKNDEEIKSLLVSQYGGRVLMAPPMEGSHAWVWLMPLLLLITGGALAWKTLFARRG